MAIAVRTYDRTGSSTLKDPSDISEVVGDGCLVWVDLFDPDATDFACVAEEFSLHPLAIEDASKHGQRPKLEEYPTHAFLVAYSKELAEVDLFIGPNWLVSVRERNAKGEHCALDGIRDRFERTRAEDTNVGFLVYTFLDEVVDGYIDAAEELEDLVTELEARVVGEHIGDEEVQRQLLVLRRELLALRRVVLPVGALVQRMSRGEVESIDEVTRVHLRDVEDHVARVIDQLDADREALSYALDFGQAVLSSRVNQVMKRMTSWGALLLGATLIAGIYGMNFTHMPELDWLLGYPWALGLMALMTTTGYLYFKRKDWL